MTSTLACTWCDAAVPGTDGFRLAEIPSGRRAVFCRLEHLIPWEIKGSRWDEESRPGTEVTIDGGVEAITSAGDGPGATESCAHCGQEVGEERVVLTRHRGPHTVSDTFCSLEHAAAWARAGGRWQ